MSSDQDVELTSGDDRLPHNSGSSQSSSTPFSNSVGRPSLGEAYYRTLRQSLSGPKPYNNDHSDHHDLFIDVGDREGADDDDDYAPQTPQHDFALLGYSRLQLPDIAEENPDDVAEETSYIMRIEESTPPQACLTQEQVDKLLATLFTKDGGMEHRTKYQYLKEEERVYIRSLNLMSIWYMMPYGYKGSHGINKRLRGRIIHDKWRPLLHQAPKGDVTIQGGGQTIKALVTCANIVTKKSIEGLLHFDVCNNHMVKVTSKLPYSEWSGDRVPVCNLCCEEVNLGLDGYYFHCPAKRCLDTCNECIAEISLDPEIDSARADLSGRNYQPPEVDYDYRVGDCQYVCKGVLCHNCAVSEQQEAYESTHGNVGDDTLSPNSNSKASQLISMKSMVKSARSLKLRGIDTRRSAGSSRSIMSGMLNEGKSKKMKSNRKNNRESLDSQLSYLSSQASPGIASHASPGDESAASEAHSLKGLLSEDREQGDEHDGTHFEEHSVFEMLPVLMEAIEKEPSVFFPYLDAYIVSGLRTSMSVYNTLFLILITAIQIFVPLILMLQVRELFQSSYTVAMNLFDDSNSNATTRSAGCIDMAEGTLDYYSATHADYISTVSCVPGYLSSTSFCSRYQCTIEVQSICNREDAFDRQVAGFFMISILIIITLQQFYFQANSFIYAANQAVAKTHRQLTLQHVTSETSRLTYTYSKLESELKRARETHFSFKKCFYIMRYASEACLLYVVMRAIVLYHQVRNVFLRCLGQSLPRRYQNDINDLLRQDKEAEAIKVVDVMYTAAFHLKVLLLPSLDSPHAPDDEIKYVLAHVIHHRLPVPYSLLNLLYKTDPKLAPIHPNAVLLSLLANFLAMGFTLTASLYVTVQSKQVSDIVVNTLALQFLLALDDMIEKESAYSDIQVSAIEAKSLCYKIKKTHETHEHISTLKRKSRSSIIAKNATDLLSPDPHSSDNAEERKKFNVMHRKLNENTTDPHSIYAYTSLALSSFIVTGYWGIYDIFMPSSRDFNKTFCKSAWDALRAFFYYGLWLGICGWACLAYGIFGLLIVLPISLPLLLVVSGVVIIVYGVRCI